MDEQIRQHERAIINLKRTRNSLLNISKLPPEVLGNIFRWNVSFKDDFDGFEEESHNFLLVCHHWHEVALGTPELWSFWGNTLTDWARWSRRSGAVPVDLVIDGTDLNDTFDDTLSSVLRDCAARDTIRRVHLRSVDSDLLRSIISQITPEEPRSTNIESFILQDESGSMSVDISDFLTRNSFPKLQRLEYFGSKISLIDPLKSRSPILTTLNLFFCHRAPSPSPTTPQLLSLLASYPTLQKVALSWFDPDDGRGAPSGRASLHHLEELELVAPTKDLFGLLDRLDHPRNTGRLRLTPDRCLLEDISRFVGPYLRDYLQRRGRSPTGLGLSLQPSLAGTGTIWLLVGDMGGIDFFNPAGPRVNTFMTIIIPLIRRPPRDLLGGAVVDLIARTPQEEIIYFRACEDIVAMNMKDIYALLPNLRGLHFRQTSFPLAFLKLDLGEGGEIFPSLQFLFLEWVAVDDVDWSPLATFLDRRATSGNQLHTLVIASEDPPAWNEFERAVRVYKYLDTFSPDLFLPSGY